MMALSTRSSGGVQVGPYDFKEGNSNYGVTWMDHISVARTISGLMIRGPMWMAQNRLMMLGQAHGGKSVMRYTAEKTYGYVTKSSTVAQLRILVPIKPLRVELEGSKRKAKGLPGYNKMYQGNSFSARWISEVPDRKPDDPVIIYYHGGGFALKMASPQVNYIIFMARALLPHRVSILALDYTVTPYARYPQQLEEAIALYSSLTKECNNITLLGDSCGGNLALALILATHGKLPGPWGLVLLSPWVDLTPTDYADSSRDVLGSKNLSEMQTLYCDPENLKDPLCNPKMASMTTWQEVIPERALCVWGEYETLAKCCRSFAEQTNIKDRFEEARGQHDCMLQGLNSPSTHFLMSRLHGWYT